MQFQSTVNVWDPLVRIFHWSLALFFITSYLSGEEETWIHPWSGYVIVVLLLVRLVWGVVGSKHARFADFIYSPAEMLAYAKGLLSGDAKRYLGHNPLGGLMIIVMMVSLALTTITGMMLYGVEEGKGPLAGVMAQQSAVQMPQIISSAHADDDEYEFEGHEDEDEENEFLEEIHEFFANFTLLLVFIHLAGVFGESLFHKESLLRSMWTGKKRAQHP